MSALLRQCSIPAALCLAVSLAAPSGAQTRGGRGSDRVLVVPQTAAPAVRDAPYAAEAITTVTQVLGDGTRIERSVTAKVFRDRAGRTRREQTVIGLASLTPGADGMRVITIADPVARLTYTLDERTRTARQSAMLTTVGGLYATRAASELQLRFSTAGIGRGRQGSAGDVPAVDSNALQLGELLDRLAAQRGGFDNRDRDIANLAAQLAQQAPRGGNTGTTSTLGTRQLEGLTVTGRRTTQTIPIGEIGNDRPIVITDETWESPDLQVVVSSRHADPRSGTVEYRLANVRRGEQPADLFAVPPDYTMTTSPIMTADALVRREPFVPLPPIPALPALPPSGPGVRGRGAVTPFGLSTQAPFASIVGEVNTPGSYQIEAGTTTVQQVIELAGGMTAKGGGFVLRRLGRDVVPNATLNTPLQRADVIVVETKRQ